MKLKQSSCGLPELSARYQWFVAQNLETDDQIFYTIDRTPSYYQCRIPELIGRRIRGCYHGWLILSSHRPKNVTWSLWNPVTHKLISLPPLIHEQSDFHECCLSSPPDDPNSIFLFTTVNKPSIVFCRINVKRKRLRWIEMSYAKQLKRISGVDGFLETPTCFNDKTYAMVVDFYCSLVMQIDIVVKRKEVVITLLKFVGLPTPSFNRCPSYSRCSEIYSFLKGYGTELFYIKVGYKGEKEKIVGDLYMFRLDVTRMIWEEMEDLKDAIFFMEYTNDSVSYRPKVASELGGYMHFLGETGKAIYSYNVKNRTISISSSMPGLIRESQVSACAMLESCRLDVDSEQEQEDKDGEIVVRPINSARIEEYEGESHLLDIPFPLLEMIMELCIGVEYMNFRATCKHCHLAAPVIQWSNKTSLNRLEMYSLVSPLLMVFDKNRGIITFIDPICGDKYFISTPQELGNDYHIYCSRYGWLLMKKDIIGGPLVFFNPFTGDIRELPWVPYSQNFCFSAPPTSSDCMVVGFSQGGTCWAIIYNASREQSWRRFDVDIEGDNPYYFIFPTFYGRDIYALRSGGVDFFRESGEEDLFCREHVVVKDPKRCCRGPAQYFLANCDQHFYLVMVGELGESIEVFKLDDSKEKWEKTDSLGNHMIYISDTTCLCVEAKLSEMEDKIYFPRLSQSENGGKIVFYSLETCRYHAFNGKNIQQTLGDDFLGTKYHCDPHTWVEPRWY